MDNIEKYYDKYLMKKVFLVYTFIFIVMCSLLFFNYYLSNTTIIWKQDARINLKNLVWYNRYLKQFFNNFFVEKKVVLPLWNFYAGEGADIFQYFHHATMGDPFNFFVFLVPEESIWIYYCFMQVFRVYVSGLFFILLCFKTNIRSFYGILCGTFTYVFCFRNIILMARHHFFITPTVYYPLIILGIEYILHNKKPYLYILTLSMTIISCFYFFYMQAIVIIIYCLVRVFFRYKKFSECFAKLFQIFIYSLIACLIAGVILVPIVKDLIIDARASSDRVKYILFPNDYYEKLLSLYFSPTLLYNWTALGFAAPSFLTTISLFTNNDNRNNYLKIFTILVLIFLIFPIFGQLFNGGGYITNRWTWCIPLLVSFVFTKYFDVLFKFNINDLKSIFIFLTIYSLLLYCLTYSKNEDILFQLILVFISLLMLYLPNINIKIKYKGILLLTLFSIFIYSHVLFIKNNYISECLKVNEVNDYLFNTEITDFKRIINDTDSKEYIRYEDAYNNDIKNTSYIENISTTNYFATITDYNVQKFRRELQLEGAKGEIWSGYDGKTSLLDLASVKYFVTNNKLLPYDYSYVTELKNKYKLYKNNHFLPLFYTYNKYLTINDIKQLPPSMLQELMMENAILDNNIDSLPKNDISKVSFDTKKIKYKETINSDDILKIDNTYIVSKANSSITFDFDGLENSETYVEFKNFWVKQLSIYDFYLNNNVVLNGKTYKLNNNKYNIKSFNKLSINRQNEIKKNKKYLGWGKQSFALDIKDSEGKNKKVEYISSYSPNYINRHNFNANLGYSANKITSITITFPNIGIYKFDDISIYCTSVHNYLSRISNMKSENITDIKVDDEKDEFSCTTSFEQNKFMCAAMPYYNGWKAYIDDNETEIYKVNYYHMGINVPSGDHTIIFKYENPFAIYGRYLSLLGIVIFIFMVYYLEKKDRVNGF